VIDSLDSELPELKNFILPEGTERATYLFYARAIVRRVERELVSLSQSEEVDSKVLVYFNRLSDFLFILARYLNFKSGFIESVWRSE
jgi:cob(I)alamin adenosyltransferase